MVVQTMNSAMSMEPLPLLLPAMEQTLWELQPLPNNPDNLMAHAGTYIASLMAGYTLLPRFSSAWLAADGPAMRHHQVRHGQRHLAG